MLCVVRALIAMCTEDGQVGVTVECPIVEIESNDDIGLWTQQAAAGCKGFPCRSQTVLFAMFYVCNGGRYGGGLCGWIDDGLQNKEAHPCKVCNIILK